MAWGDLAKLVTAGANLQTRSAEVPETLAEFFGRLGPLRERPWRRATSRESIGVPAVWKAVSLISNTIGTLSMVALRNGSILDGLDTPIVVKRPNPFTVPFDFFRDSADYKARLGETWWWIAKRDTDGMALTILTLNPREITVDHNPRNPLRPVIKWLGNEMSNDDMRLMKYMPDPDNPYRGIGPLQACGAAVSVAVEAQEYAANFFAGSPSDTWIKYGEPLDADEATKVKEAWMASASGLPHVTDNRVDDVKDISRDPARAQLSDVRLHQNGEVALMFSMPPTLLNYAVQGSTITYQNVGQIADDFLRQCLLPHYLEPMEQNMSDLLTRSTVARFNTAALLRPDPKTHAEVDNLLIPLGIKDVEVARAEWGYAPGDVETRPVPFSPPAALLTSLPVDPSTPVAVRSSAEWRCEQCGRKLAVSRGRGTAIDCRCGLRNVA